MKSRNAKVQLIRDRVFEDLKSRLRFLQNTERVDILDVDGTVKQYTFEGETDQLRPRAEHETQVLLCPWITNRAQMTANLQQVTGLLKCGGWWLFAVVLGDGLGVFKEQTTGVPDEWCDMQFVMQVVSGMRMQQPVVDCSRFELGYITEHECRQWYAAMNQKEQIDQVGKAEEKQLRFLEMAFVTVFVKACVRQSMREIVL